MWACSFTAAWTLISGGFIYDRNLVRYLREAGDRVDVISLPWRPYGLSLLDNLNPGLRRRLQQAAFDVLLEDELVHPSCFWLNQRLRPPVELPRGRHRPSSARPGAPSGLNAPAVPPGGKELPGLGGRFHLRQPHHPKGRGGCGGAGPAPHGGLSGPRRPARRRHPEEIMARATAPGPFNLIFVGNLIPRKELHTLLAALASLPGTIGG